MNRSDSEISALDIILIVSLLMAVSILALKCYDDKVVTTYNGKHQTVNINDYVKQLKEDKRKRRDE